MLPDFENLNPEESWKAVASGYVETAKSISSAGVALSDEVTLDLAQIKGALKRGKIPEHRGIPEAESTQFRVNTGAYEEQELIMIGSICALLAQNPEKY